MRNRLLTITLAGSILLTACATTPKQTEKPTERDRIGHIEETIDIEEFPHNDYEDPNLLRTLTGKIDSETIGRLYLYKDGKREIELSSSLGSLRAVDYDNDGLFDQIEGSLRKYANNISLNLIIRQIIEQNRN